MDGADTLALTAKVTNDKNTAGVKWSLSGVGTLSNTSTTSATYTAPAATSSSQTATVTATSLADSSKTGNITLTVAAKPTVATTSTDLTGAVGAAFSITLKGSGGVPPYKNWAVSTSGSALPACLTLDASTGVITTASGKAPTASCAGTYTNLIFTYTDSGTPTALTATSSPLTLTITAAPPIALPATVSPVSATDGVAYTGSVAATGGAGALIYTVTAGSLPKGLALDGRTGTITGTPAAAGTANFTVQASDAYGDTPATQAYALTVNPGAATHFAVAATSSTTIDAGGTVGFTVTALDVNGATATGYAGTVVLSSSDTQASFAPNGGKLASGVGTFVATFKTAGTQSVTATDSASSSIAGALPGISVSSGVVSKLGVSAPVTATNGAVINFDVTAQDAYGNTVTSFADTVHFTSTDSTAVLPGDSTLVNGMKSFSATLKTDGTQTITATDTSNATIKGTSNSIAVSAATPVSLQPSGGALPAATEGQSYSTTITASGGASPFTWSINGTAVGAGLPVGNSLTATVSGNVLTIAGTPTTTTSVTLTNVKVVDNSNTSDTQSYTIAVNSSGQNVSGQIYMNTCSGQKSPPAITLSINTSPVKTATTDNNGNYSFSGVPNGTYTITPSISGPSSVFYPATQSVTVNNSDVNSKNFNVSLGYTVSGTVSYSGSKSGHVYVILNNNNCGGNSNSLGTSITSPGSFTINGVAPGSYSLSAFMDIQGHGAPNANDPSGTASATVSSSNVTGADVTMTDASAVTLSSGPTLQVVAPGNGSAAISYSPIKDNNGVEEATSYTVQWSTSSGFGTVTGSKTFTANGDGTDVWMLTGLTNAQTYYFRADGTAGSSTSPWTVYGGSSPTAVTIGAPSSGSTISGTVTFTGTASGPLMVGFYSQKSGIYFDVIQNPVSPQAYTVDVPNGTYGLFGIIDQNKNGIVDSGDITNVNTKSGPANVTVSGNATENLTLPSDASTAEVTTQYWQQISGGNTNSGYALNFDIREGNELPVAVELTSGPNVVNPIDLAACSDCGTPQFQYYVSLDGPTPAVGDAYVFHVTYSDSTTADLTAHVTGWNGTSSVVGASDLATNLSPNGTSSTSTTPTFTWTDPTGASSYTYQFTLWDNNGNTIWQIPSQDSSSNGFDSSITSITWGTDPTDSSNKPSVGSLTTATPYNWQIQVEDSAGNQAQSQVSYTP